MTSSEDIDAVETCQATVYYGTGVWARARTCEKAKRAEAALRGES